MTNCIVHPIPLFQTKGSKARMTYLLNFEQELLVVNYVWYIEGPNQKILVDAGGDSEVFATQGRLANIIQSLDSGLAKYGLTFDDIDLVILTHLHDDHVAQACRFSNARFLVQKDELEFAQNPHPAVATMYNVQLLKGLKFEVISGDAKICEGISVIKTPGHSPGGQSVCIKTSQGTAIISGLCTIKDNFEPPPPFSETMPVITPAIHTNTLEAYDNVLKIKEMADIVIPLHEASFQQKASIPEGV